MSTIPAVVRVTELHDVQSLFNAVRNDVLAVEADLADVRNPIVAAITDPGASGAIAVNASGSVNLVSGTAETRTLAAPTFRGQTLSISMKTDGGDIVVTCATLVNQALNNTITFNDAGDHLLLIAKQNGNNLRWSVAVNDGCTLSTV